MCYRFLPLDVAAPPSAWRCSGMQRPGQRQQSVGNSSSSAPYISSDPPLWGFIHLSQSCCCSVCPGGVCPSIHPSVHPAPYSLVSPSTRRCVRICVWEGQTHHFGSADLTTLPLIGESSPGDHHCVQPSLVSLAAGVCLFVCLFLCEERAVQQQTCGVTRGG